MKSNFKADNEYHDLASNIFKSTRYETMPTNSYESKISCYDWL